MFLSEHPLLNLYLGSIASIIYTGVVLMENVKKKNTRV